MFHLAGQRARHSYSKCSLSMQEKCSISLYTNTIMTISISVVSLYTNTIMTISKSVVSLYTNTIMTISKSVVSLGTHKHMILIRLFFETLHFSLGAVKRLNHSSVSLAFHFILVVKLSSK